MRHRKYAIRTSDDRRKHTDTHSEYLIVITVHGSTKYFTARQQYKGNALLHFHGNSEHLYIVDSYSYTQTTVERERIFVFLWQQWLRERTTMYRCTYTLFILLQYQTPVPWLRRLVADLAPRIPLFDPRPLYVAVLCWTKWYRNKFLCEHPDFPLSV